MFLRNPTSKTGKPDTLRRRPYRSIAQQQPYMRTSGIQRKNAQVVSRRLGFNG